MSVQIGAADAADQPLGEHEPAVPQRGQHGHGGAEFSIQRGIGQLEVQRAQLDAADAVYAPIAAHDWDAQQHGGLPCVLQFYTARPEIALRRPVHGAVHELPAARELVGVKLQIPSVVQLQILLPGDVGDTAEVDHRRRDGAAGAEVGVAQVDAAPRVLRHLQRGVGRRVQYHMQPQQPLRVVVGFPERDALLRQRRFKLAAKLPGQLQALGGQAVEMTGQAVPCVVHVQLHHLMELHVVLRKGPGRRFEKRPRRWTGGG